MQLPLKLNLDRMQTLWKSILDPLLQVTITQGQQLSNIALIAGTTSINHGLAQPLTGWFLTRIGGAATIYDSQAVNPTTDKTLQLVSSAPVTVSIWVY